MKKPMIIILVVLGLAALGVASYFIFFNKSSPPPPTPGSGCKPGVAVNCGSNNCCPQDKPKCCNGICYDDSKGDKCIDGLVCPKENVCVYKDPKTGQEVLSCCGYGANKDKTRCDSVSGQCISCTSKNPPCQGKRGTYPPTPPICCGLGENSCYVQGESSTNNPCVCSGGDKDGYGGECCSTERSKTTRFDGSKLDTSICCPKSNQVVDINNKCCDALDIDDTGACNNGEWLNNWCATLDSSGNISLNQCDTADGGCSTPSVCFSGADFANINAKSPLKGTCSGLSGNNSQMVCVMTDESDIRNSSLMPCQTSKDCAGNETCKKVPFYSLPSVTRPKCVNNKCNTASKNPYATCQKDSDCGTASETKLTCTTSADCPGFGIAGFDGELPCIEITGVKYDPKSKKYTRTGKYVKADGTDASNLCDPTKMHVNRGQCRTGCPKNNPTTYCDSNQQCLEYTDASGKTQGYCASMSGETPGPIFTPTQFPVVKPNRPVSLEECKIWCESSDSGAGRGARCVLANEGDADNWFCQLSQCQETKEGARVDNSPYHLVAGDSLIAGSKLNATISRQYNTNVGPGRCFEDLNYYGVNDINYNAGNNLCVATYSCEGKKDGGILLDSESMTSKSVIPGVSCFTEEGQTSCNALARVGADLSNCNVCTNGKCSISGESCSTSSDCAKDPYGSGKNLPCSSVPTGLDGLLQSLSAGSAREDLNHFCLSGDSTGPSREAGSLGQSGNTGSYCSKGPCAFPSADVACGVDFVGI